MRQPELLDDNFIQDIDSSEFRKERKELSILKEKYIKWIGRGHAGMVCVILPALINTLQYKTYANFVFLNSFNQLILYVIFLVFSFFYPKNRFFG